MITDEEREQIVLDVINEIVTQSTSLDEAPEADTLQNVTSLPAYKSDSPDLVKVPLTLISKLADDAAIAATEATEEAKSATGAALTAASIAGTAALLAKEAAEAASSAANEANGMTELIEGIKTTADSAKTKSDLLAEQLKNYTLEEITEESYAALTDEDKQTNTLYLCFSEEEEIV